MNKYFKSKSVKVLFITGLLFLLYGCAYYNTFYNARKYFTEAEKEFKASQDEKVSAALKKKFDSAINKSNVVMANYPTSKYADDALYIIAMSNYYKGSYMIARKQFEEFAAKYPQSELYAEAMVWYGRNLWKMNERELAFYQWKKIMTMTKDDYLLAELYSLIGELYFNDSAYDSARIYYTLATDVGRSYEIAGEAQYRIAIIDLAQNRPADAIKNLKKVDQYSPSLLLRDKMQILIARIYRESGQYDKAIEMINEKLNNSANESIWGDLELELGMIYLKQQNYELAMSRFSQIVEKYAGKPVEAEAHYHLAELYMKQYHDYENASKEYDALVKIEKITLRAFEARSISSEIKRFNTISKRLLNLNEQIAGIDLKPQLSADTLASLTEISRDPEELKKTLEKKSTAQKKQIDTLAIFKEYYNSMYEIAEIFHFNFNLSDSAIVYLSKVSGAIPYNHLRDKALYGLYRIYKEKNELQPADECRKQLAEQFPESQYLAEIENRAGGLPPREAEVENLLAEVEQISDSDPVLAIARFDSLAKQYADTQAAEKSVMNIAYLYHHRLFDLNNALKWYAYFVDTYPTSKNCPMMRGAYDQLKAVESAIAKAAADTSDGIDLPVGTKSPVIPQGSEKNEEPESEK
jgi:outer membrane protein assembly factor BamD (BamD/ComL family)